jgi:hypothetical protein
LQYSMPKIRGINYYSMITKDLALRQGAGLALRSVNIQRFD